MVTRQSGELRRITRSLFGEFSSVVFFSFVINAGALLPAFFTIQVLDRVLNSRSEHTLFALLGLMLFLLALVGVLKFVRSRQLTRLANQLDQTLAPRVFDLVFRIGLEQPAKTSLEPLDDLTKLRDALVGGGLTALLDAPWIPIFYIILFIIHPWVGFTALTFGLLGVLIAFLNNIASKSAIKDGQVQERKARDFFVNSLRNADATYAMGMMQSLQLKWLKAHYGATAAQAQCSDKLGKYETAASSVRSFARVVIISVAAYLVLNLELTPGAIIACMIISSRALGPLQKLVTNWRQVTEARLAYTRLGELLDQYPENPQHILLPEPEGALGAEGIFAGAATQRAGEAPILKGVSFQLDPGETLAVLGPSGSGKSTIARVLLGIWPTLSGTVRLDGNDVRNWDPLQFGRYVGYLPQDVQLFGGTIAENIARFGKIRSRKVVAAAKLAGVHKLILNLGKGYLSEIGPGGTILSAGQRQRIALARALYDTPRVVVLDEPNSNLDNAGETALMDSIDRLKKLGSTIIFIAHRKHILEKADKVLIMMQGQVRFFGTKFEFLKQYMPELMDSFGNSVTGSLLEKSAPQKQMLAPLKMTEDRQGKTLGPPAQQAEDAEDVEYEAEVEEYLNTEAIMMKWRHLNAA